MEQQQDWTGSSTEVDMKAVEKGLRNVGGVGKGRGYLEKLVVFKFTSHSCMGGGGGGKLLCRYVGLLPGWVWRPGTMLGVEARYQVRCGSLVPG